MTLDYICDAFVITSDDLSAAQINAVIEEAEEDCEDEPQDTFAKLG